MKPGTIEEAMKLAGRSRYWVRDRIKDGTIPVIGKVLPAKGKRQKCQRLVDLDCVPIPGTYILFEQQKDG